MAAELGFVGVGLGDERDLSERAWECLHLAREIFAEEYTSRLRAGAFDRIAARLGRPVTRLSRAELESERPILAALDRGGPVVLLVPGDPFTATTHGALRRAVEAAGHRWRYLPNASIVTAAPGLLGLMAYKFGRIASLPFPEPGFAPSSPLDVVRSNRGIGAHTLLLLDLRPEEGRFMTANDALALLRERDRPPALFPPGQELAVVARVGTESARGFFGPLEALATTDFGPPLHALVVPAPELHFEERAALERLRVGRPAATT